MTTAGSNEPKLHEKQPLPVTLAILLGGESRRMGVPKHTLIDDKGNTLLNHQLKSLSSAFCRTLLLRGAHDLTSSVESFPDPKPWQGEGPLAGLLAALENTDTEWLALAAVDQPHLSSELYRHALSVAKVKSEALIYIDSDERRQWLCGLYKLSLKERVQSQLQAGTRAMWRLGEMISYQTIRLPSHLPQESFANINTPEEARALGFSL